MTARILLAVGTSMAIAGGAQAQMQSGGWSASPGHEMIVPAGDTVYSNPYDGVSTFGNAAQIFEPTFTGYDIWLGDDFSTSQAYTGLSVASVGFCGNGCIDPFNVLDFFARIYDGLPNDPSSEMVCESDSFSFNGIDTWTASFADCCLPAGDYQYAIAARNDGGTNGQTFFFQQNFTQPVDDGWQWNPGGAFGFPGNFAFLLDQAGVAPASPNAVIMGEVADDCGPGGCLADCDGNEELNILDFVCFQQLFQSGDEEADCDENGELNILDFVCFQQAFQEGC